MDQQARSFLLVAAVSPLVAVLSFWSLLVLHSYRRQWRTVDLFFVAVASQEFLNAVFSFGHALLNLTRPSLLPLCTALVWTSLAVRTFQLSTVTSMLVDRALTVRWPYQYRLSVRRNQVCYHIAVLAVTSGLVGVASVFAKTEPPLPDIHSAIFEPVDDDGDRDRHRSSACFLLPFATDQKFVIFVVVLHGCMLLLSLACLLHVQLKLCCCGRRRVDDHRHQVRVRGTIPPHPFLVLDSPSSTASSGGGGGALWSLAPSALRASSSLKRESVRLQREFRWKAVAVVAVVCIVSNHVPYLVMMTMARFVAVFSPVWLESGITCLALAEGLVLPIVFWAVDPLYRASVAHNFVRRISKTGKTVGATYLGNSDSCSGTLSRRESCSTLPRLEPMSTYSSVNGFVCNDTLDKKVLLATPDMQWRHDNKYVHVSNSSLDYRRRQLLLCRQNSGGGGGCREEAFAKWHAALKMHDPELHANRSSSGGVMRPLYSDPFEAKTDAKPIRFSPAADPASSDEHIYATLGEKELTDDDDDDTDDVANDNGTDDDDDSSSLTTSASDDFEFHLTLPTACHHPLSSSPRPIYARTTYGSNGSLQTLQEHDEDLHDCGLSSGRKQVDESNMWTNKSDLASRNYLSSASPSRASTMSLRSSEGIRDLTPGVSRDAIFYDNLHTNCKKRENSGELSRKQRNASLSMNDLDLLNRESEEDVVYVVSGGKSESTISLYRLTDDGRRTALHDRPLVHATTATPVQWIHFPNSLLQSRLVHNLFRRHSSNSIDCGTAVLSSKPLCASTPGFAQRQYVKNPLLTSRLSRSNAMLQSSNWKYRPAVVQRQDFPWRKSPTRPFQAPWPLNVFSPENASNLSDCLSENPPFYQKKFISEFL